MAIPGSLLVESPDYATSELSSPRAVASSDALWANDAAGTIASKSAVANDAIAALRKFMKVRSKNVI